MKRQDRDGFVNIHTVLYITYRVDIKYRREYSTEIIGRVHDLLELSPSPLIFVEYERRRYFNWFVVENERGLASRQSSASRFAPPVSEVDLICRISQGRSLARIPFRKGVWLARLPRA